MKKGKIVLGKENVLVQCMLYLFARQYYLYAGGLIIEHLILICLGLVDPDLLFRHLAATLEEVNMKDIFL